MRHSRADVWWRCVCVVATVGGLCTYAEWGWNGPVMAVCTVGTVAGSIGASVWAENGRSTAGRVTARLVAGGWFLTAAIGLVAVFGLAGGFLVALLVVLRPGLLPAARRVIRTAAGPAGEDLRLGGVLEALDDEALCRAWRRTFLLSEPAESSAAALALVDQRSRILDELHRRSPDGLAAWWVSGGPASGSPLPYLGGRDGRSRPGTG